MGSPDCWAGFFPALYMLDAGHGARDNSSWHPLLPLSVDRALILSVNSPETQVKH